MQKPLRLSTALLLILSAQLTTAAAQSAKETAQDFKPTAAQRAEATRLRAALAAAVGDNFEVARERLARRSNWHGGGLYWLAYLRAVRPGEYYVKYRYRYKDHVKPKDPLYTFVEHQTLVRVGPQGCGRRPRYNFVCVGDTLILPVLVNDYTEHTFWLESQPFSPGDAATEKTLREMDEAGLDRAPVPNPAAEFVKYLGSRAHYSPHRAPGFTVTYTATFEAVKPGRFNLSVGASSVSVLIVEPGAPLTILSSGDSVHGYTERFSSSGSGNSYLMTPVILQPGERLTLRYGGYSHSGFSAGGENEEAIETSIKDHPPVIALQPFTIDPAQEFNEWLVEFLPPARRQ